jgi:hypothetical protein
MGNELKAVLAGTDPRGAGPSPALDNTGESHAESSTLRDEIDSLGRARANAEREADATRRLDELKRRMGK